MVNLYFTVPMGQKKIEFDNDHPTNGTMIKKLSELNENYAIVKETYIKKISGP